MDKTFKIATFDNVDGKFEFTGYTEYEIKLFVPSGKKAHARIIVNDKSTQRRIPIKSNYPSYKHRILCAISDYVNEKNLTVCIAHTLTREYVTKHFTGIISKHFFDHYDAVVKETSRDRLTKHRLIPYHERDITTTFE